MVDTNHISSIVKILDNPIQKVFKNTIPFIEFKVQLPQVQDNIIINLVFLDDLGQDTMKYFQINDYILIEGYFFFESSETNVLELAPQSFIQVRVLKVYPLFFSYNRQIEKL